MSPRRPLLATMLLLLATVFWGASFPLTKAVTLAEEAALPGRSSWFYSAFAIVFRFGAAALLLALFQPGMLRAFTGREWRQGLLLGGFVAGGMLLQNDGLAYTEASTSAFLTSFYCLLLPLAAALRQRAWPHWLVLLSTALVLAGVALISGVQPGRMSLGRGEWETLACSFFFAGQILTLERPEFAANHFPRVTFLMFATAALLLLPVTLAQANHPLDLIAVCQSGAVLSLLLALTVLCTLVAFGLMIAWQPHVEATQAGLIYCAEPVFTSLLALFVPALLSVWAGVAYANESLGSNLLIGGALITAANILILLKPRATLHPAES